MFCFFDTVLILYKIEFKVSFPGYLLWLHFAQKKCKYGMKIKTTQGREKERGETKQK